MNKPHDALAANDAFDLELKKRWGDTPQEQLRGFAKHARRTRRNEIGIAVALVACLVLGLYSWRTSTNADHSATEAKRASITAAQAESQAAQVKREAFNQCVAANGGRADQLGAWEQLIATFAGTTPQTPAAQQRLASFQAYLHRAYAPRDCSHLEPNSIGPAPAAPSLFEPSTTTTLPSTIHTAASATRRTSRGAASTTTTTTTPARSPPGRKPPPPPPPHRCRVGVPIFGRCIIHGQKVGAAIRQLHLADLSIGFGG